jgi:hypothetical protein
VKRLFAQLEAIDAKDRLDTILITGDMTDAGISTEWVDLFEILGRHPGLAEGVLILPVITTSTSSTAPTRHAWFCRRAPTGACARSGLCPP